MLMSTMCSLNISKSINIRRMLMLMLMLRLSSLAHKFLMPLFLLKVASQVRTGNDVLLWRSRLKIPSASQFYNFLKICRCCHLKVIGQDQLLDVFGKETTLELVKLQRQESSQPNHVSTVTFFLCRGPAGKDRQVALEASALLH